jgi:hypothetical protein
VCRKKLSVLGSEKRGSSNKMKKSYRSCVNVVSDSRRNAPRLCVQLAGIFYSRHLTSPQADDEIVEQLRSDMENLIAEVSDLSRRNDELMTSKDSDLVVIRDLDAQLKEYKRKYEQAKTELRSVKGICAHAILPVFRITLTIEPQLLPHSSCKNPSSMTSYLFL